MPGFKWPLPLTCPFCIDRAFQGITTIVIPFADATANHITIIVLVIVFGLTCIWYYKMSTLEVHWHYAILGKIYMCIWMDTAFSYVDSTELHSNASLIWTSQCYITHTAPHIWTLQQRLSQSLCCQSRFGRSRIQAHISTMNLCAKGKVLREKCQTKRKFYVGGVGCGGVGGWEIKMTMKAII